MRKIVLASTSPRRKELLQKTGLPFIVDPGDYEEDMTLKLKPIDLAKVLSQGKAESVVKRHKDAIIIGADTFVAHAGQVLGKPHTPKRAMAMLKELSGKAHYIVTGFTIIDTKTGRKVSRAVTAKIYFKKINAQEISKYVGTGEPLEKAGAYAIQERGSAFIKKIEGDFFGAMGLPIFELVKELKSFGVDTVANWNRSK
jgi:septum formation protein